ncbi:MAG TPA: alpha/beta hydrolase [Burkholderiales bacterium]|nr:alpha/beta hydrolase [Burkholderiales bacterium]
MLRQVQAGVLDVGYFDHGPAEGEAVVLLHGFPYDVHAYDNVVPRLVSQGFRVLTPYLRGYGPTRFLSGATPRSGQQACLAQDVIAFMDALQIPHAVLAGYDWGGRAACIVAALWPQRVRGLISACGYNIQDIAAAAVPQEPEVELKLWYQYYFHGERGRLGLQQHRSRFCHLLWQLWSPTWRFDESTYQRTAAAFDNPDFVEVVIHSYRHRYGLVQGDPAVEDIERRLIGQPTISVPTVVLHGDADGVIAATVSEDHDQYFSGPYERQIIAGAGHNLPQETPREFASAVLSIA